jgi:hypothetical protein
MACAATCPASTRLFSAASVINAKRIAQLVAEAGKRGEAEMVDEAKQWVKSHEPSKQE